MRLSDFEAMVVRMAGEVPREFLDGVGEIVVSPRTVAHHVEHIYSKLGVTSRALATLFATQNGLVGSYEADPDSSQRWAR